MHGFIAVDKCYVIECYNTPTGVTVTTSSQQARHSTEWTTVSACDVTNKTTENNRGNRFKHLALG